MHYLAVFRQNEKHDLDSQIHIIIRNIFISIFLVEAVLFACQLIIFSQIDVFQIRFQIKYYNYLHLSLFLYILSTQ